MSLLAARCKAIRRVEATKREKSEAEILPKLVAYTSEQVSTKIYFQSHLSLVYGSDRNVIPLIYLFSLVNYFKKALINQ